MLNKTEKSKAIISFLEKDLLINQNMIGIIENVPEAEIYVDDINNPKGVFIKKDYFHYIYSKEDSFIDEVCDTFFKDGFYGLSGVETSIAQKIKKKFEVNWENPCDLYYMPKENLDLSLMKNEVRSIDVKDAETIDEFYEYRHPGSVDGIKKDILERPSSAIYVNGEIVCWVLVHPDNSIGIMYTKEEHRRKGYAVDVTIVLASKIIRNGKIPYLQIVNKNSMSPGLAQKCGFVENGLVEWFGIIAGTPKELIELNDKSRDQILIDFKEENILSDIYDGMYVVIDNLKESKNEELNFNMKEVVNSDMINTWCEIVSKGFNISEEKIGIFTERITSTVFNNSSNYKFYIGYLNEKPVSTSCLLKHKDDEEVTGVYFLSTLSEVRNQGVGSKTLIETLKLGKEIGCYMGVVQAPKECSGLFEHVGFRVSHTG